MITKTITRQSERLAPVSGKALRPKITLFHCVNAIGDWMADNVDCDVQCVKMPCSSMTREVFLLRAFESGADGVIVAVCPEGSCRYVEGNLRAAQRVARVKKLLDEIGMDGRRLSFFNIPSGDHAAINSIVSQAASELADLGPNPAA